MENEKHFWVVVLAAGEGSRLRSLTTDDRGVAVPKQFCSFRGIGDGRTSLLRSTLARAARLAPQDRIVTVVAAQHRRWWSHELSDLPEENVVIQPDNRGTAPGFLLPLLEVYRRDRQAKILALPSDHYVEDEEVLEAAVNEARPHAEGRFNRIILFGIRPDVPDTEYGWIVPSGERFGALYGVDRFVEKPPVPVAEDLMNRGGLWNSFLFVAAASTYLRVFASVLPEVLNPFLTQGRDLPSLYEFLPARDFSRDVLEKSTNRLRVLPVSECGWSDLGTPKRVASVLGAAVSDENPIVLPQDRFSSGASV